MTKTTECKTAKEMTQNEKYLYAVFSMLKKREGLVVTDKKTRFNDTELRLIGEVLMAKHKGERLISTEIAVRLGVTRSAISQIVNRLEAEGVVERFPDDRDKKIAYVEVTETTLKTYEKDIEQAAKFVGRVVSDYGAEKFEKMCAMIDEFMELMKAAKQEVKKESK